MSLGNIYLYDGPNKTIKIKNDNSITATTFNGTCNNAINADRLLDDGIYKSNTELKVKFSEEPLGENSELWATKITKFLNNNKLKVYDSQSKNTVSDGIAAVLKDRDLKLKNISVEHN